MHIQIRRSAVCSLLELGLVMFYKHLDVHTDTARCSLQPRHIVNAAMLGPLLEQFLFNQLILVLHKI